MDNNPENWPAWATEKITIVPYDAEWPIMADELIDELNALYNFENKNFEHVGSTAVLNLPAKPIIDLILPVNNFKDLPIIVNSLKIRNWNLIPPELNKKEGIRTFIKVKIDRRYAHLHLVTDNNVIERYIKFRDILRRNQFVFDGYVKLKSQLALKYNGDREAYTMAKSSFIETVLNK